MENKINLHTTGSPPPATAPMRNPSVESILMTPGPVPMPDEVRRALSLPMEHHRTPEFEALFKRVLQNLKRVFLTEEPAFVLTSTGTGAMEAAIVNCLSPGDEVIVVVSGKFGERWAEMAKVFGYLVHRIEIAWGSSVTVAQIDHALKEFPRARAVFCQACETSTGALHPVREIAQLVRKTDALFIVDAITALGALPIPMDEWHIDVMIGGSQKAFMLPTGLAFISFSKKAWAMVETARTPRFYFDIRKEKKANQAGESGWSAPVTHIRALDTVLDIFLKTGMSSVHGRIQALSAATRAAIQKMGLTELARTPSPSLTAVCVPDGIDGQQLRSKLESDSHVVVMGGQDHLKGKIVRIGHMGAISDEDLLQTLRALATTINQMKSEFITEQNVEAGLEAARMVLLKAPAVLL